MKCQIIDAFTSEIFKGNPAAVCLLKTPVSDELMQKIAAENNLSETAFAVMDKNGYHLRWFTPLSPFSIPTNSPRHPPTILMIELTFSLPAEL